MQSSVVFSVFVMTTQICELDGKIISGARSLYSHNKLHLNEEHKCSICSKSFATREYLNLHHKNVHSEATYNCNECEEVFRIKKNLKRHIENLHLKVEYCCEICGKKFPRQDTLKRHKDICKKKHEKGDDLEDEMNNFFFYIIRDLFDEAHTDRSKFQKRNTFRRRLM